MRFKRKIIAYSISFAISSSLLTVPFSLKAATFEQQKPIKKDTFIDFESNQSWIEGNGSSEILDADLSLKINQSIVLKIKKNELEAARQEISDALLIYPKKPSLYTLFGVLETREKKYDLAKKWYKKAIELDKDYTSAYMGLAEIALFEKQFDQAKNYYKELIRINRKNYGAYIVLANLFYKEGDNQKAINSLLEGHEQVKGSIVAETKILIALGKIYGVEKQPDKFLPLAKDLLKRFPSQSPAFSILADAYLLNNNKRAAEKTLFQLLEVDPQNINQRVVLIKLLASQVGKKKQALKQIDKLINLNPNKLQLFSLKVDYLIRIKDYDAALDVATVVVKKFPNSELGFHLLGDIYRAKKDLKQALDFYQQAYKLEPKDNTLFLITDLLVKQGKQDKATELLEGKLKKQGKAFGIRLYLANLYLAKSDFDKAETHFEMVLSQKPDNVRGLNNLAWLYLQKGDAVKALPYAEKAYKLAPSDESVADTYRSILLKNGRVEEAKLILENK